MRHILLPPVARTEIGGRRGQVTSCYQLRGELKPGPDWGWQQPKYLHTTIKNGFQTKFWFLSFDDLNLQQNDLRVKPVRVWAQAWVSRICAVISRYHCPRLTTWTRNLWLLLLLSYYTVRYNYVSSYTLHSFLSADWWLRGCVRWTLNILRLWSKQMKLLQHFSLI